MYMFFHYFIVFLFLCNYASLYCSHMPVMAARTSPHASPVVSDDEEDADKENNRKSIENPPFGAIGKSAKKHPLLDDLRTAVINFTSAVDDPTRVNSLFNLYKIAEQALENFPEQLKEKKLDAKELSFIVPEYLRLKNKFSGLAAKAKIVPKPNKANKAKEMPARKNSDSKKNIDTKHIPAHAKQNTPHIVSQKPVSKTHNRTIERAQTVPRIPVAQSSDRQDTQAPQIPAVLMEQAERSAREIVVPQELPVISMTQEPLPERSLLTDKPAPRVRLEPFPEDTPNRMTSAAKYACVTGLFAWLLYKVYYYDQANQDPQNDQQKVS